MKRLLSITVILILSISCKKEFSEMTPEEQTNVYFDTFCSKLIYQAAAVNKNPMMGPVHSSNRKFNFVLAWTDPEFEKKTLNIISDLQNDKTVFSYDAMSAYQAIGRQDDIAENLKGLARKEVAYQTCMSFNQNYILNCEKNTKKSEFQLRVGCFGVSKYLSEFNFFLFMLENDRGLVDFNLFKEPNYKFILDYDEVIMRLRSR